MIIMDHIIGTDIILVITTIQLMLKSVPALVEAHMAEDSPEMCMLGNQVLGVQ